MSLQNRLGPPVEARADVVCPRCCRASQTKPMASLSLTGQGFRPRRTKGRTILSSTKPMVTADEAWEVRARLFRLLSWNHRLRQSQRAWACSYSDGLVLQFMAAKFQTRFKKVKDAFIMMDLDFTGHLSDAEFRFTCKLRRSLREQVTFVIVSRDRSR